MRKRWTGVCVKCKPVLFPGGKTAGDWRWTPTPSSSEVKERVKLDIYSPSGPSRSFLGWTFTFKSTDNISGSTCAQGQYAHSMFSTYKQTSTFQDRWSVYRLQNSWFWSHTAAYAVFRRFLQRQARVPPQEFSKGGFVTDKVALWQASLQVLLFPPVSTTPPIRHIIFIRSFTQKIHGMECFAIHLSSTLYGRGVQLVYLRRRWTLQARTWARVNQ